ncbi:MAG: hypothetical protein JOZ96_28050 [Acidobacteria bacterium]|nr:hypothetical protein [Acidobacteriota bacterium]
MFRPATLPLLLMLNLILLLPLLASAWASPARPAVETTARGAAAYKCSQPAAEREALIRKAEAEEYTVRRVEFLGNEHTSDQSLRRRILLMEGDPFTRKNLVETLRSLSRARAIYPVGLADVELSLSGGSEKEVDTVICFREKRRR